MAAPVNYSNAIRRRLASGTGPTGGTKNLAPSGNTRATSIIRRTKGGKMSAALKNLPIR